MITWHGCTPRGASTQHTTAATAQPALYMRLIYIIWGNGIVMPQCPDQHNLVTTNSLKMVCTWTVRLNRWRATPGWSECGLPGCPPLL
eukprot:871479-Prorocentrum_minimum.AAC.1